ncbi:peptide ABC transporter substrate-binding protein [Chloroflexota bacterium]
MKRVLYLLLLVILLGSTLTAGCQFGRGILAEGETLNLYGVDPITLDPAVSGEMTSHQYILQLFSGLVRLDEGLEPAPDIAEGWQISSDGKTYTFSLRKDVSFHDGRRVKAGDFKYSWERAADPATGSKTAATYLGDVVGVDEVIAGRKKEISGVTVIDDYTLQVTIDAPKAFFLSKLTYPTAFVVDRANVASGDEWWQQPNGTGPFKLREWAQNNLLLLEKNGLYYGKMAEVDSIVFQLWSGVLMNMYETGEIDVSSVSINYIDKVTDTMGVFYRELQVVPELSFGYIGFNVTSPPFDDVNIRRAFTQAIDKDKIVSVLFKDMVRSARSILPPGMPGYNENLSGLNYDANIARELIIASRYGSLAGLPPITITVPGMGGVIPQDLEAIIQEWRNNLDVEVNVRQLEPERFLYHLKQERDEMFYLGWVADYPHPQNFLDILFRSGVDNNYGGYSSYEVDTLLERAAVETDNVLSLALYQRAEQKLVNDAACLPLWFGRNYILVKPHVNGYVLNPMGFAMLNEVSVDIK